MGGVVDLRYSSNQKGKMMGSANIPEGMVKKETMIIAALVALIAGFIGGVAFSSFQAPPQQAVVAQNNAPQQSGGQGQPGPNQEAATRIFALENEVKANPGNTAAWTQLGNIYFDTNQPAKSIEAYRKSLALNPSQPDVLTDMGVMLRNVKQFKEAIATFDQAIALNPKLEAAYFNKGIVYIYDLGDKNAGLQSWQQVLAINPAARAPNGQSVRDIIASVK